MLLNQRGLPEPPSHMLERLKAIDPGFGLLFGFKSGCWNITLDWPLNDPRRKFIQRGEVAPTRSFDILTQLPPDCSADEAFGYLVNNLRRLQDKGDIKRLLDRADMYNKRQQDELLKPHRELAEELIETNAKTLFRNEGKHIPRTRAPRGARNTDAKRLRDHLHDLGHAVEPSGSSIVKP